MLSATPLLSCCPRPHRLCSWIALPTPVLFSLAFSSPSGCPVAVVVFRSARESHYDPCHTCRIWLKFFLLAMPTSVYLILLFISNIQSIDIKLINLVIFPIYNEYVYFLPPTFNFNNCFDHNLDFVSLFAQLQMLHCYSMHKRWSQYYKWKIMNHGYAISFKARHITPFSWPFKFLIN